VLVLPAVDDKITSCTNDSGLRWCGSPNGFRRSGWLASPKCTRQRQALLEEMPFPDCSGEVCDVVYAGRLQVGQPGAAQTLAPRRSSPEPVRKRHFLQHVLAAGRCALRRRQPAASAETVGDPHQRRARVVRARK